MNGKPAKCKECESYLDEVGFDIYPNGEGPIPEDVIEEYQYECPKCRDNNGLPKLRFLIISCRDGLLKESTAVLDDLEVLKIENIPEVGTVNLLVDKDKCEGEK